MSENGAIFVCCFLLRWRNGRKPSDRADSRAVRARFARKSEKGNTARVFSSNAKCLAEFFERKAKKLVG